MRTGYGRCTQFLKELGQHLILVDIAERCIAACQQRFSSSKHISYHVNDGKSLAMIPNESVDFLFSYDSLVHAEANVLEAYLLQLGGKLSPNGIGFIHHSNLGAYRTPDGELPFYFSNDSWRATSMTAKLFEEYCRRGGLQCISQELIVWRPQWQLRGIQRLRRGIRRLQSWVPKEEQQPVGEQSVEKRWRPKTKLKAIEVSGWFPGFLTDCFSTFTPQHSKWSRENRVVVNKRFTSEKRNVAQLSDLYFRYN